MQKEKGNYYTHMAKEKQEIPKRPPPAKEIFNLTGKLLKKDGKCYTLKEPYEFTRINQVVPAGSILKERNDGYYLIELPDSSIFFVSIGKEAFEEIKERENGAGRG